MIQPINKEFEFFLNTSLQKYKGKYVAIVGKKVVASGDNAKKVWKEARKKSKRGLPLLAKVPTEEVLVSKG